MPSMCGNGKSNINGNNDNLLARYLWRTLKMDTPRGHIGNIEFLICFFSCIARVDGRRIDVIVSE